MLPKSIALIVAIFSCMALAPSARSANLQRLPGHVPKAATRIVPSGRLEPSRKLNLAISLPLRNQPALAAFLKSVRDPASPGYRHFLKPHEFAERFGPTPRDYQALIQFAQAHNLAVTKTHPNRLILDVVGAVPAIEQALNVTLRTYHHPTEARLFYAPDKEPSVALAIPIAHISGLDNYWTRRPNLVQQSAVSHRNSRPNGGSGWSGSYAGGDFRAAYAPGVTLTGSGQCVALVEYDSYFTSDIANYESQNALPNIPLVNIPVDGGIGPPGSNNAEVALDIEMAACMAPGMNRLLVYEAPNPSPWVDILNQIATDDIANQVSSSWSGGGVDPASEAIFQEMAAQGQSYFNASGDTDAYTGDIPFPCESPNITVVGATTLTTGAGAAYASETVWNWNNGTGSSGGISTDYSIPTWQQGIDMTANQGSTTMRNIPDVAMAGDNILVYFNNGTEGVFGGTSCAAPLWAAFTALVNQEATANGNGPIGFLNPVLYPVCTGSGYAAAMHDTTTGNNFSSSSPTEFSATAGYDLFTGWGSPNGTGLIDALAGPPTPYITTGVPLPNASAGIAYSQTLNANGGVPPYTWLVTSGTLPSGLSLDSGAGLISGTPAMPGAASFSIRVTDSTGASSSTAFTLTVYPAGTPVIVTTSPLATGTLGMAYSQTLAATGGAAPYTWSIVSGTLPGGLNLTSGGALTGSPTASGSFGFTIQVTCDGGLYSASPFSLYVPALPSITSPLSATGTNYSAFTYQIVATNNTTSYSATGLPSGLSVNTSTGLITGTVTSVGTDNVTLYATNNGGTASAGLSLVVNQMPPPTIIWPFTTLHSFNNSDGANPLGGLIEGSDGNFYGTTVYGGDFGLGSVFKMGADGSLNTLLSFDYFDGYGPFAGLIQGENGTFYGTTYAGGDSGNGAIFQVTSSGSLVNDWSFEYSNGADPADGLVWGNDGNLYGTARYGGTYGTGSIFKLAPGGSLSTPASFSDGGGPTAGLIQGTDGNFYGTTQSGGSNGDGSIFRMTPDGTLTTLVNFNGTNGSQPLAGLVQGTDGNFYGVTYVGGDGGEGTVFQMAPDGALNTLCSFSGTNGACPVGGLVQGNDGNLYGTTIYGGTGNAGTLFMATTTGSLATIYAFSGPDGANPQCPLIQASSGSFYGTASGGGNGYGTVFSLSSFTASAVVNTSFTYQISAASNSPPNPYTATNLPAGLSLNPSTGLISGTPTSIGTANVTIGAVNPGGAGAATLTINVLAGPSPFSAWQSAWFGPTAPSSIASGTAINNTAGIPNLMAFALGMNPFNATCTGLPLLGATVASGSTYLTLTFQRNTTATDLTYTVEATTNLRSSGSWSPIATFSNGAWSPSWNVTETGSGPLINVQVQDTIPINPASRFLRLHVTH